LVFARDGVKRDVSEANQQVKDFVALPGFVLNFGNFGNYGNFGNCNILLVFVLNNSGYLE